MDTMKNILRGVAVAGLAGGLMFAQGAPDQTAGQPMEHSHRMMRGHRGQFRKLMAGYLGLTDDQQAKAKSVFESAHQSAQPIRQQLKQVRADLRTAIEQGKPVNELASTEGNLVGQLAAIRANTAEQFRALLTPQQIQKLQDLHTNNRRQSQQG